MTTSEIIAEDVRGHEYAVVLFDGVCNLCNGVVDIVLQNDPAGRFRLLSLQSDLAGSLVGAFGVAVDTPDAVVLLDEEGLHSGADAVLRIVKELNRPWRYLHALRVVPPRARDILYRWVAGRRYVWFERRTSCRVPTEEDEHRFVQAGEGDQDPGQAPRPE